MRMALGCVLAVWGALGIANAGQSASDLPAALESSTAPDTLPTSKDLFAIAMQAAAQTPALQKRARTLSDTDLLSQLATHGRRGNRAETAQVDPAAALAALPDALLTIYTQPHAVVQLNWQRAADIRPVRSQLQDWATRLKVKGEGAAAVIRVEPLEALFGKDLPAADVAQWLVLEDGELFGDLTLYNPNSDSPACCRVLSFPSFGTDLPTAYGSLRAYLEFQWVLAELQARREHAKAAPAPP